jgi:2-polyprenyl-3-methyl-5-hydroxy-6-metoxy-1,4-benzoquinol methylase
MEPDDWDKLAVKYHEEIISPFQKGVINPLFKELNAVKHPEAKIIADIGCGRGEILDFLASRFKKVYAMDFSPMMIKVARQLSSAKNIIYSVNDMRYLTKFKNKFDIIVCANSILMPKISDVRKSLKSIYSTLKRNGRFYAIFPSMGSIIYQGFLLLERETKRRVSEKRAIDNTKRAMEYKKYNFIKGTFKDGKNTQKFYYDFEISLRLREAGFRDITLSKVLYPWRKDISDFVCFPDKPKMWDIFVTAKK